MKLIYTISKSPIGYADHQHRYEYFYECESEDEYNEVMAKRSLEERSINAREYYDAHCWQGKHFDAVGGSEVTANDYLNYRVEHYIKPGSIINRKEVKVIDNWWWGS